MRKNESPNSWFEHIRASAINKHNIDETNITALQKAFSTKYQFDAIFYHSIPMIYLVDYTSGKYLFASKTTKVMVGYERHEFMDGGLDLVVNKYQKDDLKLFNEKIFPDRLKILNQIPAEEHSKYVFSYNFRLKNKDGEYVTLLQRNSFIKSDTEGRPLLSFGMVMNVTHFTKENPVIQLVEKVDDKYNSELSSLPFHKKIYYLNEEDKLFSNREKEILRWTADGLTSKQIAEKLFIGENTVINHRKNMLLKSGTKNTSELVAFSLRNNII